MNQGDILSQWEEEANDKTFLGSIVLRDQRILALIDLIRKKDEALKNAVNTLDPSEWPVVEVWREALALTEDLK